MARYIDADKLIWQVQDSDKYGTITKQVFISLLQNSETADVAPVIHAHWVPIESSLHVEKSGVCSECGEAWPLSDTEYFYHCPKCGAKMDGEHNDG